MHKEGLAHVIGSALAVVLLTGSGCTQKPSDVEHPAARHAGPTTLPQPETNDAAARAAFLAAYPVFMHPRCVNCHPAGDAPLQGEDSVPHGQNVKRGPDGMGLYALRCITCHGPANMPGEHMPPGNPNWRLPHPDMPLVFEGLSAGDLCRQLKDPQHNGGKTLEEVLHHVAEDSLVLWGWDPGDGRSKPPLSHEQFVQYVRQWIESGAACPE